VHMAEPFLYEVKERGGGEESEILVKEESTT
jgi:hypothetical protein